MKARFIRLCKTFIAKKYVAWLVATGLVYVGKIESSDWVLLTVCIFAIDAYSKYKLLPEEVKNDN